MGDAIAAARNALLNGRLKDLEASLLQQRTLCGELQACLMGQGANFRENSTTEVTLAKRVRNQSRMFEALLRMMRANLEALRNWSREPSLVYDSPSAQRRNR
jgi:hypothetical protein